jgi:hypothetical protein
LVYLFIVAQLLLTNTKDIGHNKKLFNPKMNILAEQIKYVVVFVSFLLFGEQDGYYFLSLAFDEFLRRRPRVFHPIRQFNCWIFEYSFRLFTQLMEKDQN